MNSSTAPFTPNPDVITENVDGEAVLLDMKSERYFGLNAIGARIWQALRQGSTPASIETELAQDFPGVPREQIAGDVGALLKQLLERGLLRTKP